MLVHVPVRVVVQTELSEYEMEGGGSGKKKKKKVWTYFVGAVELETVFFSCFAFKNVKLQRT